MVGIQIFADTRIHAAEFPAGGLGLFIFTGEAPHVGSGPAEIRDNASERWAGVADALHLSNDRVFRTALYDAALVLGNRAKSAAAEAAPHDVDRVLNHLHCRDCGVAVRRMR